MPKTFKEAKTERELVTGTPVGNQVQIDGTEIVGAHRDVADNYAGWTFNTLKQWTQLDAKFMDKTLYDSNDDGVVDSAAELKAGGQTVTTAEVRTHIDDTTIHFVINDTSTATNVAWSGSKINTEIGTLNTAIGNKEDFLNNPASDGQQLVSTAAGVRSWEDEKVVPTGGTEDQIIVKNSATEQDAGWVNIPIAFATSWNFDNSTAASDPGNGNFRLNAATRATATAIYVSQESSKGINLESVLQNVGAGERFVCYEQARDDRAALYELSADPTDNGTWWTLPVIFIDQGSGGEFRDERTVVFQFFGISAGTDLTDAVFPTWAGFENEGSTAIVVSGNTNIDFSASNKHALTGSGATTINTFTFPQPNAHYSIQIPSAITITGVTATNKQEVGTNNFTAGKYHIMSIYWDGTTAVWQTSEAP